MSSTSKLIIDLDVVKANVQRLSDKGRVMGMIKANGYGTDAIQLAAHLKAFGVSILGVSHVNEAIQLREAGIGMPIFVLSVPPFEAEKVAHYNLEAAVSSIVEIEALNRAARRPIPVHLHIDTGMSRFGASPSQVPSLAEAIRRAPSLQFEGVMTHFTSADLPEKDLYTEQQIACFKKCLDILHPLPPWIHASNTSGTRFSLPFCTLIRVGMALLEGALTLESHLSFIGEVKKGESVGYHCNFVASHTLPIGVIPFGYYDGIHRHYKEQGYVQINGKKAPMIGNICMDFMMVDLTAIPEARVGDRVTLFDPTLPPETVAGWGKTDVRELLVSIGPRTERIFRSQK